MKWTSIISRPRTRPNGPSTSRHSSKHLLPHRLLTGRRWRPMPVATRSTRVSLVTTSQNAANLTKSPCVQATSSSQVCPVCLAQLSLLLRRRKHLSITLHSTMVQHQPLLLLGSATDTRHQPASSHNKHSLHTMPRPLSKCLSAQAKCPSHADEAAPQSRHVRNDAEQSPPLRTLNAPRSLAFSATATATLARHQPVCTPASFASHAIIHCTSPTRSPHTSQASSHHQSP